MVLRYTLELEDQTAQFYRNFANEKYGNAQELFSKFSQNSEKRKKELERTARESVDHSFLEPVSGLTEEAYKPNVNLLQSASTNDVVASAKQLEELMQNFYQVAGEKVKFIANVSRLYKRYAQDRAKALAALQQL